MRSKLPSVHRVLSLILLIPPATVRAQATHPNSLGDSVIAAASRAVDNGRPWQATRLLAKLISEPAGRTPSALIAAARAAAGWEGWGSIIRYLGQSSWLPQSTSSDAHGLLGRALLERNQPDLAIEHTERAVALASPDERATWLVAHGRALDRNNQRDSAATVYRAAAKLLPEIADWLLLRAAGVTVDSAIRQSRFDEIALPVARARIGWTDALARDRAGDWRGSAKRYAAVGATLASARQLLKGDSAARRTARNDLISLLGQDRALDDAAEAIAVFDREFPHHPPAEELRIARRAAAIGLLDRSARGFGSVGRNGLTDRDRFTFATVLARLGRGSEAVPLFDQVTTDGLRANAAYLKARLLLRTGHPAEALQQLVVIPSRFPHDSEPAASSLFLRADLYADRQIDDSARGLFLEAATRFPDTRYGQRAAIQAAIIALVAGKLDSAEAEFTRIAAQPNHDEAVSAGYWTGRAAELRGDTGRATARYRAAATGGRDGYYAMLASRRLGNPPRPWPPDSGPLGSLPPPLARARRLLDLGMRVEARFELEAFTASAGATAESLVSAGAALAKGRWYARAAKLGQRAQAKGAKFDQRLAAILFPLPFADVLIAEARTTRVTPSLVAGVIRQESAFDPEARSTADARGLMQVLPSVGGELVGDFGIDWDPVLLYQPDVNLDFGIRHLDAALEQLQWPERALAAYNAGLDRATRWRAIRGVETDPEIFVERIPFAETRDYVRRVLANQAMYLAIYGERLR